MIRGIVTAGLLAAMPAGAQQALRAPLLPTLSEQARTRLTGMLRSNADAARPRTLAERRAEADRVQHAIGARMQARYDVTIRDATVAGVPVRIVEPRGGARAAGVLLNLHGGGFVVDAGSLTETIPIAALTGYRVVAVRYRLSPEHVFPAALDDAVAVYTALAREGPVGVFGTSAGAILGPELVARLKRDGRPQPAVLGVFSGSGDLADLGDAATLFGDPGMAALGRGYIGTRPPDDLAISPKRGDLAGWPPTLCVTSSRDFLLSATAGLCGALDDAGVPTTLVVHDGLPHAFWSYVEAPESDAAFARMARFLRAGMERRR